MIARRGVVIALAMLLAGCAASSPPTHVMRHLDTPEGVRDARLNAAGEARARALVAWFAGKRLDAIYVTPFARTRQTVAPLAAARGIAPTDYDWTDRGALLARIAARGEAALIVGHSNTVPDIVEALGGVRPAAMVHADFGDIWTIEGGRTVRVRLP